MRKAVKQTVFQLHETLMNRPPWSEYPPFGRRMMWMGVFLVVGASVLGIALFGTLFALDIVKGGVDTISTHFASGEKLQEILKTLLSGFTLAVEYVIVAAVLFGMLASTFFVRRINWGDRANINPIFSSVSPIGSSVAKLSVSLLLVAGLIHIGMQEFSDPLGLAFAALLAVGVVGLGLVAFGGILSAVTELANQTTQRRTPDNLDDQLLDGVGRSEMAINDGTLIIKKEATRTVIAMDEVSAVASRSIIFGLSRDRLLIGIPVAAAIGGAVGYYSNLGDWMMVFPFILSLLVICVAYLYTASLKTKQVEVETASGQTHPFVTREDWHAINTMAGLLVDQRRNKNRSSQNQAQPLDSRQ